VLACLFLLSVFHSTPSAQPDSKKLAAPELLEQAVRLRTGLEGKPKRLRTASEYIKVINQYRSVYYQFPVSSKADDAVLAVAELYQLLATDFKEPGYFVQAVKAYVFLEREYPASPYAPQALFTAAEIYLNDLNDAKTAEDVLRGFLQKYPNSSKARNARARLDDLRAQARQTGKSRLRHNSSAVSASAKVESPVQSANDPDLTDVKRAPTAIESMGSNDAARSNADEGSSPSSGPKVLAGPVIITDLRFWNTEDYTRVVVNTGAGVRHSEGRLESPPRLYLDLHNAKLSSLLAGRTFSLNDGYVSKIRLGQVGDQVARLVLDLGEVKNYQVLQLSDPGRVLIEIQGPLRTSTNGASPRWKVKRGDPLPDELNLTVAGSNKAGSLTGQASLKKATSAGKSEEQGQRKQERAEEPLAKAADSPTKGGKEKDSKTTAALPSMPKNNGPRSLIRTLGLKIGRIVIDPGHGGHDTGTIGPSGLQEKELVLDVALKLSEMIEDRLGSEVILTRGDDTFVPLEDRTALANQNQADLFVSIHANASRNRHVSGVETFFLNFATSEETAAIAARENASSQKTVFELQDLVQKIALKEKIDESREFAQIVQRSMASHLQKTRRQTQDRGVKQAPFIVLIGANMPSILSEISFVSNPADEKLLKSSAYRQKIAEALCNGIEAYTEALGGIRTARNIP
jgi:N-acetylmuramoyl-L-alanine amidase